MTLRMDAYDFMYNEALLATTEKSGHNIYPRLFTDQP